jgi:hypothetical protein
MSALDWQTYIMQTRTVAALCAVAAGIGAPVAAVLSQQGSQNSRKPGTHVKVQQTLSQFLADPVNTDRHAVVFTETVTNTGTTTVYGLLLKPGLHEAGGVHDNPPSLDCGVGDVSSARAFRSTITAPHPRFTGEHCGVPAGLAPGASVRFSYATLSPTAAQAAAYARAGAKVEPLPLREASAFGL